MTDKLTAESIVKVQFSPRSFPMLGTEFKDTKVADIPNIGTSVTVGDLTLPVRSYLKNKDANEVRVVLGVSPVFANQGKSEGSKQGRAFVASVLKKAGFEGDYFSDEDDRVKFDEDQQKLNFLNDEEDEDDDDFDWDDE